MRKYIDKQIKKLVPRIERAIKWLIRTFFELIQLATLGWSVLYFIVAPAAIEYALAGITVFTAAWFTKRLR